MPLRDVQKAADKARAANEGLVQKIREARREGLPLRDIAKHARMSHEQVRRLTS